MPEQTVALGHARRGQRTITYNSWRGMVYRCRRPTAQKWRYYGGRGIKVCEGWQGFANFLADMGERPSKAHSIDRIDTNGNYSCGHCEQCVREGWPANGRWLTQKEQCANRRPMLKNSHGDVSRAFAVRIAAMTTTLRTGLIAEMFDLDPAMVRRTVKGEQWRDLW